MFKLQCSYNIVFSIEINHDFPGVTRHALLSYFINCLSFHRPCSILILTNGSYVLSCNRLIMRSIFLSRILFLTASLFRHIHGYVLGPGCAAYAEDISIALDDFWGSAVSARSSLNPQNNEVEDWFGLLEPLFSGLSYSTPYAMQQQMLDPDYDVDPETISLTETFQSM